MTALTANANIPHLPDQELREFYVAAAEHIYRGAFVGVDPAGYAKAFVPGDVFVGIAYEESDNSAGAAAATKVQVYTLGDFELALTSAALTHTGQAVFATDDSAISLIGHPDAFVGRVVSKDADTAGYAIVRLRGMYDKLTMSDAGFHDLATNFGRAHNLTGAASAVAYNNDGWFNEGILGLGNVAIAGTTILNPAMKLQLDATSEAAVANFFSGALMPVARGITFEATLHMEVNGATVTDFDWGLGSALTANSNLDIDHADMAQLACFHMDAADDAIYAQSDDATTDVVPVDTLANNILTDALASFKKFKIIVRPTGAVEFWIDGARVLSTTTFAVLSTAVLQGWVNLEKTTSTDVAEVNVARLRMAGAMAHAV